MHKASRINLIVKSRDIQFHPVMLDLSVIRHSTRDVRLLWAAVFLRMMAYGLTNQVLTLFLAEIGVSPQRTGWWLMLTNIGDAVLLLYLSFKADVWGRRRVLVLGCVLMAMSGAIFAYLLNYWLLLFAAVVGVISPLGDETGPFKSVEEASLAHITTVTDRPTIYAIHGLMGTLGAGLGSVIAGVVIDKLSLTYQWEMDTCYRVIFVLYAVLAVAKMAILWTLTRACEVDFYSAPSEGEMDPLLEETTADLTSTPQRHHILPASRRRLMPLLLVFMLDSMGYGFMPWAWVVYYIKKTFSISATALGTLFLIFNCVNAVLLIPSAWFAVKLGSVRAILATQAPLAVMFAAITFVSNSFYAVAALLVGYAALLTLDVVPRQMLLTHLFPSTELSKVLAIVNIGKTAARSVGPPVTGWLASHKHLRWGFFINGACVLVADIVLATTIPWDTPK